MSHYSDREDRMRIAILMFAILLAGCDRPRIEEAKPDFQPGAFVKLKAASTLLPVYGQITHTTCGRTTCGYYVRWPDGSERYMRRFEIEAPR